MKTLLWLVSCRLQYPKGIDPACVERRHENIFEITGVQDLVLAALEEHATRRRSRSG